MFIKHIYIIQSMQKDGGKIIRVRTSTYEKLNSMGDITSSFDSVITDLIKKAEPMGASATTKKESR